MVWMLNAAMTSAISVVMFQLTSVSLVNFNQGFQKQLHLAAVWNAEFGKIGICRLGWSLQFMSSRCCPFSYTVVRTRLCVNARISKAWMAFANLLHLWRRNDVSLVVKGHVYNAAVCSVLLYGCETWPLRQQDVHRLEVFDHRCLRQLATVGWSDRVSNLEVRNYVLGGNGCDTLPRKIKLCRLRWLGHVLRMEPHRLQH